MGELRSDDAVASEGVQFSVGQAERAGEHFVGVLSDTGRARGGRWRLSQQAGKGCLLADRSDDWVLNRANVASGQDVLVGGEVGHVLDLAGGHVAGNAAGLYVVGISL